MLIEVRKIVDGVTTSIVVGEAEPLPIAFVSSTSLTSRSGTVTTGGVAQALASANSDRKGWFLQNVSNGDLWVNSFGGTASAAQPSLLIKAGSYYETPAGGSGAGALSIFGATTGQSFTAGEW